MGAAGEASYRPSRKGRLPRAEEPEWKELRSSTPRTEMKGPGCEIMERAWICGALIYNLGSLGKPSSLRLFYSSCAFNYLWVERQFSESSPSHKVDVPHVQRLPPSWCVSRKLLLAVPTLIRFSDRVSWSTKHTLGRLTVCASGCNKELDFSWCGGSAQWATRRRMVSFFPAARVQIAAAHWKVVVVWASW